MMHSAARKHAARAVWQDFGEVVAIRPAGILVRTETAEFDARRAVGCLVEPRVGDRVLIASQEDGDAFVLSVLSRAERAATTISAEGDLLLRAADGKVTIAGQRGVDVASGGTARIAAAAVEVSAVRGRISAQWLEVLGEAVVAELGKVKMVASTFDAVLERFSQRAKRSYRTVEEVDQVRAHQIDYAAEGNARLRGENTLVTAIDVAKMNGEQVHLG
jgi:hypothetical protein